MSSFIFAARRCLFWGGPILLLAFLLQLHIGNAGGTGKNLPQTAIIWGCMSLFSLGIIWRTRRTSGVCTPVTIIIFIATLLLWLPWFYTQPAWRSESLWPLLGLFAGVVFYLSALQFSWSLRRLQQILMFIIIVSVLQAGLVLWQYAWPGSLISWLSYPQDKLLRQTGVFQQVNLLASFIATGFAATLLVSLSSAFSSHRVSRGILVISLVLLPLLLVLLQSRIGWLGAISATLMLLLFSGRQDLCKTASTIGFALLGVILGIATLWSSSDMPLSHENSDYARSIMLRDTLAMIQERPWLGWGYGGFEYNFQHFRLNRGESTLGVGIATHPHNEFLYRWVEGGVVGLAGMLLLALAGGWVLWQAYQRERRAKSTSEAGVFIGLGSCLLPFLLHTQTEYPFYLSALHWGMFLLLLAIWDRLSVPHQKLVIIPQYIAQTGRTLLSGILLATLIFTSTGGYSGWLLWRFEQQQFQGPVPYWQINPWLLAERARFDEQVASLLVFNQDRSLIRLNRYAIWAKEYSCTHIDREVYAHLVQILLALELRDSAKHWGEEGHRLFPDDTRLQAFAISSDNPIVHPVPTCVAVN
ncbi:O-antigen ligase C-terminal domain-containing protein [Serratia marcescens]|nr:O-antigen ligase C-terminal domain-containing protein [Serratia marcescens]